MPFLFYNDFTLNTQTLIIVIIAGIIHTALALFLWYDSLSYISVSLASILAYLDIFFAMALNWLFLNQSPTIEQIVGSILIVIAGVIATVF